MAIWYQNSGSLAERFRNARNEKGISYKALGSLAGVDPAQALRICRGDFKTLSPNVVRICTALKVQPEAPDPRLAILSGKRGGPEQCLRLEIAAWEQTPEDAEALLNLLRLVRRIKDAPPSKSKSKSRSKSGR